MSETKQCIAVIKFGDDFGDNESTFHCQLNEGHAGLHMEESSMYGKYPYKLEWKGDMGVADREEERERLQAIDEYMNGYEPGDSFNACDIYTEVRTSFSRLWDYLDELEEQGKIAIVSEDDETGKTYVLL